MEAQPMSTAHYAEQLATELTSTHYTLPGGWCDMRLSVIIRPTDYTLSQKRWNDICRMGRWSLWYWFDV